MNFIDLNELAQLDDIVSKSENSPNGILIFKHSIRCGISKMVLDRFRRKWKLNGQEMPLYYLDIISHRNISAGVSERFNVQHESPQVLLIKFGKCIYDASHNGISPELIEQTAIA